MGTNRGSIAACALAAAHSGLASAAPWNPQPSVTVVEHEISDLHLVVMGIILLIFICAFTLVLYSIYAHRKTVRNKAEQFHDNITVEIVWTVIPMLILVVMAWPATKVLLNMNDISRPDITIKATGYQGKWGYDYLKGEGEGIRFLAQLTAPRDQIYGEKPKGEYELLEVDHALVVPVNRKIRILATANDVIRAWWVPAFGVRLEAIPGLLRDTWFRAEKEGRYRGQCAELCGRDQGYVPIVVEVVSAEKYSAWAAEQKRKIASATADPNSK